MGTEGILQKSKISTSLVFSNTEVKIQAKPKAWIPNGHGGNLTPVSRSGAEYNKHYTTHPYKKSDKYSFYLLRNYLIKRFIK